jgi:hypothetical protein
MPTEVTRVDVSTQPAYPAPAHNVSRSPPLYTLATRGDPPSLEIRIALPTSSHTGAQQTRSGNTALEAQAGAWDSFFGPVGESRGNTGDEPKTITKYLFWYGFGMHILTPLSSFLIYQ